MCLVTKCYQMSLHLPSLKHSLCLMFYGRAKNLFFFLGKVPIERRGDLLACPKVIFFSFGG